MSQFAARSELEGFVFSHDGLIGALSAGVTADDMPEGDEELRDAWRSLDALWPQMDRAARAVVHLLEERQE